MINIIVKRKRGKPPKRKSNNPFGRKGKQTTVQPPPGINVSFDSAPQGSGTSVNKRKTVPTKASSSARAIKVPHFSFTFFH